MICTKCKNKGVYNEVLGKGFYYCRHCKIEISLETPSDTRDDPFSDWANVPLSYDPDDYSD